MGYAVCLMRDFLRNRAAAVTAGERFRFLVLCGKAQRPTGLN